VTEAAIDGRPASLDEAVAEATALLGKARLPLVCGLATDAEGARAAVRLAAAAAAAFDHAASPAFMGLLEAFYEGGLMTVTAGEAAARADLVVTIGPAPAAGWPDLTPGDGAPARTTARIGDAGPADLVFETDEPLAALAALRATLAGRPTREPPPEALVEAIRAARYGVFVWDAAGLDALATQMLAGLVKDLNAERRFSGLPLWPGAGAATIVEVAGWLVGYPVRTAFGSGRPSHDPLLYDATRLAASGEADLALWVSGLDGPAPAFPGGLPVIALAAEGEDAPPDPRVRFAVGRPGRDHDGVLHDPATGALRLHEATEPGPAPSAAAILDMIAARLPGGAA